MDDFFFLFVEKVSMFCSLGKDKPSRHTFIIDGLVEFLFIILVLNYHCETFGGRGIVHSLNLVYSEPQGIIGYLRKK